MIRCGGDGVLFDLLPQRASPSCSPPNGHEGEEEASAIAIRSALHQIPFPPSAVVHLPPVLWRSILSFVEISDSARVMRYQEKSLFEDFRHEER